MPLRRLFSHLVFNLFWTTFHNVLHHKNIHHNFSGISRILHRIMNLLLPGARDLCPLREQSLPAIVLSAG